MNYKNKFKYYAFAFNLLDIDQKDWDKIFKEYRLSKEEISEMINKPKERGEFFCNVVNAKELIETNIDENFIKYYKKQYHKDHIIVGHINKKTNIKTMEDFKNMIKKYIDITNIKFGYISNEHEFVYEDDKKENIINETKS